MRWDWHGWAWSPISPSSSCRLSRCSARSFGKLTALEIKTLKAQIHPTYYEDALVTCVCGNTFTTGSTRKELKTEICSVCHPFFTGTPRIVGTGGQVERVRKRAAKSTRN